MTMFLEPAAATTEHTYRRKSRDLVIQICVEPDQRIAKTAHVGEFWSDRLAHVWTRAADARTSSTLNHCPFPAPGQTFVTRFQAAGDSTFSGQNGQV
jgi:hypothetical protein